MGVYHVLDTSFYDMINITKQDIIWSYVAKVFSLSSSLIVLPLILSLLSAEEIGLNYLMATISSMVMLIDFGFGPQFGRNFTYVHSGAQHLLKEGVLQDCNGIINYRLLAILLKTAKQVYKRLSLIALILMLTLGFVYIYYVTEGFETVENAQWIWIVFSISVYFNFYYSYYTTLLTGSGMIAESNKSMIFTRIVYLILNIMMLYIGWGLFAVVIANLLAPFVGRFYCYRVYFTRELRNKINIKITQDDLNETFYIIWYNAKKVGINMIGSYAINKIGMFLVGLYLPLAVVGSFGLLIQITTILTGIAAIMNNSYMPLFSKYRINGQKLDLIKVFSFTVIVFWLFMLLGSLVVILGGNSILNFINSNTLLPSKLICACYLLILSLEGNHAMFAGFITTNNEVPFVKSGLLSGLFIALFTFLGLHIFNISLLGVVLIQGLVQLAYNNWYWPCYVLKDLNCSSLEFLRHGMSYANNKIRCF